MDSLVIIGPRRRELVSWTPEARWLFQQIVDEVSALPGVKAAPQLRRPIIAVNRKFPVAGFEDGIAVRLDEVRRQSTLQIPGCRLIGRGDRCPRLMRGMVALPWSAREHWRGMARAAVMAVPAR